ncbi:MAG: homocysteine S-methyltransferase family protein [Patescibacteria group bacterium]
MRPSHQLPIPSGADDDRVKNLREGQYQELAYIRQRPQVDALVNGGAYILWAEAIRYQQEAIALAILAKEFGVRALVVCFEATCQGFPDPSANGSYGFNEMRQDMQKEAGSGVIVRVGANCTGVTNMNRILESGVVPDAMYANGEDVGTDDGREKDTLWRLSEIQVRTGDEEAQLKRLKAQLNTSREQFMAFWRQCKESGVPMFGVCCGGTPELVKTASQVMKGSSVPYCPTLGA